MKAISIIIMLFFLSTNGYSQLNINIGCDGKCWEILGDVKDANLSKLTYLRGIYDGVIIATEFDEAKLNELLPDNADYNDLIAALDKFYRDDSNKKIWVVFALKIIRMEMEGVSKEKIDYELKELRSQFSN